MSVDFTIYMKYNTNNKQYEDLNRIDIYNLFETIHTFAFVCRCHLHLSDTISETFMDETSLIYFRG